MAAARPRRRLDDVRQPQILAAAVEVLVEGGLAHVRIADIAERCGTSPTSVIYYFGTKDALIEQAVTLADDAFHETLCDEIALLDAGLDRLACIVYGASNVDWLLWMDLWVYARRNPGLLAAERRFAARWRALIVETIRHGQAAGDFVVTDPEGVGLRLGALMEGLAIHVSLGDPAVTSEVMVEQTLVAASLELGCDLAELRFAAARQAAAASAPRIARPPATRRAVAEGVAG